TSYDREKRTMNLKTTYTQAVWANGGVPVLLPVTEDAGQIRELFDAVDGVLLCGGPDIHPNLYGEQIKYYCGHVNHERDVFELELARLAIEADKPLMGICRGSQVLNVACGGTLYQDINLQGATDFKHADNSESHSPVAHPVNLLSGKLFEQVLGISELEITSWHHQAVRSPGNGIETCALAPDGIIEGVYMPAKKCIFGVEWHPELLPDNPGYKLFEYFIGCCR
ncbi:MAG: type 1 glutamine amidotransferase, partial [Clostridia bacterium]|nr:type 1 glutamine amidotransferase [Clostridia bacterium]